MRVLELFKGSGSVGKYFEPMPNVEVISLDFVKKYEPTICCDIMEWNYKIYPPGHFDIVWASPECKVFSQLQYSLLGRKGGSVDRETLLEKQKDHSKFILKTIEIIKYFNPKSWFIENPMYSKIWDYVPPDLDYKNVDISYCLFGFDYRKNTRIITNKKILESKLCKKKNGVFQCCGLSKHKNNIGHFGSQGLSLLQRYRIPQQLFCYLFCEFC
jgi:site-specific DNA-cytosine methylase